MLLPGAFGTPGSVPLLWQHQGRPIGRIELLREDRRGLRVVGSVEEPELAGLVSKRAVTGLSFGYRVAEARHGLRREILRLELVEVSLVTQPMQPLARVHAVEAI